ncbi:MAG: thioredoxin [Ignavibacteria bacterium RBG_16_34_14]|nr:MAG: thioredoxin [Ignavibacteria bacterium RBG_16_34_14]
MLTVEDVDLTPNPHALKFILNERLLKAGTRQFPEKESAQDDPFAKSIFEINGVVSVFYMDKFVTIEKAKDATWGQIQRPFVEFLKSFDVTHIPEENEVTINENEDELLKKINEILNQRVRPYLASDGGGLQVLGVEGNKVMIRYQGACGSCPSSISGTLAAIEGLLKRDLNPALEVVAA